MNIKPSDLDVIDKAQLATLRYVDKLLRKQPIWAVLQAIDEDIKELEAKE